jgi:hypothetical protein
MLKTVSTYINVIGSLVYKGTWDAATNTPTLASGVGNKGDYYVVSVPGSTNLDGITDWQVNDIAVFNGSAWQKIDNTDAVLSVNGQVGTVVLTAPDVGATANTTYVLAGTGMAGGGQLTGNVTINLANTAVAPGTYGTASQVSEITVDAQGRITSAANVAIAIANSAVSGLGTMSIQNADNVAITGGSVSSVTIDGGSYANANITSVVAPFPNNYLANSSTTLGDATLTLGGSTSSVGNLTLGNANITSGNATLSNVTITSNLNANLATSNTAAMPDPSLPLAPEGYITVYVNGNAKKIPYYGV